MTGIPTTTAIAMHAKFCFIVILWLQTAMHRAMTYHTLKMRFYFMDEPDQVLTCIWTWWMQCAMIVYYLHKHIFSWLFYSGLWHRHWNSSHKEQVIIPYVVCRLWWQVIGWITVVYHFHVRWLAEAGAKLNWQNQAGLLFWLKPWQISLPILAIPDMHQGN